MRRVDEGVVDWQGCIEVEPWQGNPGAWALRGTDYRPELLINTWNDGESLETIARRLPNWTPERVQTVLNYVRVKNPWLFSEKRVEKMDWSACPDVEQVPGKCSGAPILRNTRFFVETVREHYDDGYTAAAIVECFEVDLDQVQRVIDYIVVRRGGSRGVE